MKTRLILIRHAESEWNRDGKIQGAADVSSITDRGATHAKSFGKKLGIKVDAVYTSPLKRAVQTAEAMFGNSEIEIRTESRLTERNFGQLQGMSWSGVDEKWPGAHAHYRKTGELPDANAEPIDAVARRMESILTKITRDNPGKTIVVISHRTVMRILLKDLLNKKGAGIKSYTELEFGNCEMVELEWNGRALSVRTKLI